MVEIGRQVTNHVVFDLENGATLILGDVLEEEGQRLASELGE